MWLCIMATVPHHMMFSSRTLKSLCSYEQSLARAAVEDTKVALAKQADIDRKTDCRLEVVGATEAGGGSRYFQNRLCFDFAPSRGTLIYFEGKPEHNAEVVEVDWFLMGVKASMQVRLLVDNDFTPEDEAYLLANGWVECDESCRPLTI